MSPLVDIVRKFRSARVLVVGDAMLDSYLEGTAARLCTEGPVPVVRHTHSRHLPGGAANSAVNLRGLGATVDFVGVVGDDVPGRQLQEALRQRGVDHSMLVSDPRATTLHKLRILADDQYVVRFDSGDTHRMSESGREQMLARLERAYARCDVVVVADYDYGAMFPELVEWLVQLRRDRPVPLVVDSKNLRAFARAEATVITPNYLEARLVAVPDSGSDAGIEVAEVEAVAHRLLEQINAEHAAITMASDGVLLVPRGGPGTHLPAHPVARANDVGAGDSFTAALALALASGAPPVNAARIGVVAGGIAVTQSGTAVVSQGELLQRVSLDDGLPTTSLAELGRRLLPMRAQGRTIVFTNGVFDILHSGHVHFLRRARELGDVLVVGVNSDASVRRLKGPGRPINSERDRAALVAALDAVDHVLLFDNDTPENVIRALRPHVHVKGGDYDGALLPESDAVREVGGRVEIVPLATGSSTSGLIDRIATIARGEYGRAG